MNSLYIILALIIGNFVYQYSMGSPDYSVAIERSYFQFSAYLILLLLGQIK